jgi:ribulose-phosphate 3-epimerase
MPEIVPAIIAKDFNELKEKIKLVEPYVEAVQLDVMDGIFAPNKTWDEPDDLEKIKTKLIFEAHLMIEKPQTVTERWLESKVKRIILHWEALEKIHGHEMTPYKTASRPGFPVIDLVEEAHRHNKELGIAINLKTPISALDSFINDIDAVQFMGIAQIGFHGHPFEEKVIPKIIALRAKYRDVKIEVDGGINSQNAKKIAQAGADILVVGSSVFESGDVGEAINKLKESVNN